MGPGPASEHEARSCRNEGEHEGIGWCNTIQILTCGQNDGRGDDRLNAFDSKGFRT